MTLPVKQRSCKLPRATYPVVLMAFLNRAKLAANQITAKTLAWLTTKMKYLKDKEKISKRDINVSYRPESLFKDLKIGAIKI